MTKVPEYDLPGFKKYQPSKSEVNQEKKDKLYWRYKKGVNPPSTSSKHGSVRLKDKGLISDDIANFNHLKDIKREEF